MKYMRLRIIHAYRWFAMTGEWRRELRQASLRQVRLRGESKRERERERERVKGYQDKRMNLYCLENLKTYHKTHRFAFVLFLFLFLFLITPIRCHFIKKKNLKSKPLKRHHIQTGGEKRTGISSVRCRSVSPSLIRWLHHTGVGTSFALRMAASAHLFSAGVGTVSSALVGWVGSNIHLLTPNWHTWWKLLFCL